MVDSSLCSFVTLTDKSYITWIMGRPWPVFCLLLGVSSGCAQPITGQVNSEHSLSLLWARGRKLALILIWPKEIHISRVTALLPTHESQTFFECMVPGLEGAALQIFSRNINEIKTDLLIIAAHQTEKANLEYDVQQYAQKLLSLYCHFDGRCLITPRIWKALKHKYTGQHVM